MNYIEDKLCSPEKEEIKRFGAFSRRDTRTMIVGFISSRSWQVPNQETSENMQYIRGLIEKKKYHEVAVLCEELEIFEEAGKYYKKHAEQHREDAGKAQEASIPQMNWKKAPNKYTDMPPEQREACKKVSYQKAAEAYKKAAEMYREAKTHHEEAKMYREVAQSSYAAKELSQALEYYRLAVEIFEREGRDRTWAEDCRRQITKIEALIEQSAEKT